MNMAGLARAQDKSVYIEGTDSLQFTVKKITVNPREKLEIILKTISSLPESQMAQNWVFLGQGTNAIKFSVESGKHKKNDYIDPEFTDIIIV